MSNKPRNQDRQVHPAHGDFRHKADPATLSTVLKSFGLDKSSYERSRDYVLKRVGKEPVHAR